MEVLSRQSGAVEVLRGYSHVLCAVGRTANTQGMGLEKTVSDYLGRPLWCWQDLLPSTPHL